MGLGYKAGVVAVMSGLPLPQPLSFSINTKLGHNMKKKLIIELDYRAERGPGSI